MGKIKNPGKKTASKSQSQAPYKKQFKEKKYKKKKEDGKGKDNGDVIEETEVKDDEVLTLEVIKELGGN